MNDATENLTAHFEMKSMIVSQYEKASKALAELASAIHINSVNAWEASGGCKVCEGTGSVLTWSTLDGSGYDEFGPCKHCTEETRKAGLRPGTYSARGSDGRGTVSYIEYALNECPIAMQSVVEQRDITKSNWLQCVENPLQRQDYIIVVKGRKVPTGSHGMVVAITTGAYGARCGFIDGDGKLTWIALTNVERCLGMDGSTRQPAIEAFIKNDNDFRKSKKLPLKNHDVVAMMLTMC